MILFQKTVIAGLAGVGYNKSSSDISAPLKMKEDDINAIRIAYKIEALTKKVAAKAIMA